MKFTKQQIQVLMVLSLVVAILFAGIFLIGPVQSLPVDSDNDNDTPLPTVPHDKFRSSRVGMQQPILWENNFGGSQNDTPQAAYELTNGNLLIIGNTYSTDYDFEQALTPCTFFMMLSPDGKAISHKFFEGTLLFSRMDLETDTFLLFCKTSTKNLVYSLSENGDVLNTYDLNLEENETAIDYVYGFEEGINYVIVKIEQVFEPKVKLKIKEVGANFSHRDGGILQHPYALEYIAAYPHGEGMIVAANSTSEIAGAIIIFEWKTSSTLLKPNEITINGKSNYNALSFTPCEDGYAALIKDPDNFYDIIIIDYFNLGRVFSTVHLNAPASQNAAIFTSGKDYYVFTFSFGGIGKMQKISADFKSITEIDAFAFYSDVSAVCFSTQNNYFAGTHPETSVLSVITSEGVLFESAFAIKTDKIKFILPFDRYIIVVGESESKSLDVGGNFGGTDIWIAKLAF